MVIISSGLNHFFADIFESLPCDPNARAYIASIFAKYRSADFDLSQDNITLTFLRAKNQQNFLLFQTLGDWLFYLSSLYPEALRHASRDYYFDLARLSYLSCYHLINRQWVVYEALAEDFIPLSRSARQALISPMKQSAVECD